MHGWYLQPNPDEDPPDWPPWAEWALLAAVLVGVAIVLAIMEWTSWLE